MAKASVLNRTLRIAILVSLGIHIISMSVISIVTPKDLRVRKKYTKVDFLGPIFRKTAFDIMLEGGTPTVGTSYSNSLLGFEEIQLEASVPRIESAVPSFSEQFERSLGGRIVDFLTGSKSVPQNVIGSNNIAKRKSTGSSLVLTERKVIYRPEPLTVMRGLYGDKDHFKVKMRVLVDPEGNVKKTEPLTTTGYVQLDMDVANSVKAWIFTQKKDDKFHNEWQTVEVIVNTGR